MMSTPEAHRSDIQWIEPVFVEPTSEHDAAEEQSHSDGVAGDAGGKPSIDALNPTPRRQPDAVTARITRPAEASAPDAKPRPARSQRHEDRELPGSAGLRRPVASTTKSRPEKIAPERGATAARIRQLEEAFGAEREAAVREIATLQSTLAAEREAAAARISRLEEAFGAEREAASGAITALRSTLLAERELAVVRISWLEEAHGGERAVAAGAIATLQSTLPAKRESPVALIAPLAKAFDAIPRRHAISLLWRNRRLVVRSFALVAAALGVITYYSADLQTASSAGAAVAHATPPAKEAWSALGGPPSDPVQRVAYLRNHARAGDPAAQYALGVLYAQGEGVVEDYASAASWFRRAAKNGIVNALDLARLYERGLVTPQDFVMAAYWYHNAAEQGVVPAMINSARLYERGQGVAASPVDAYAWYRAAARRGDAVAEQRAAALFQHFTGADKVHAVMQAAALVDTLHEPPAAPVARLMPGGWIGDTHDRSVAAALNQPDGWAASFSTGDAASGSALRADHQDLGTTAAHSQAKEARRK